MGKAKNETVAKYHAEHFKTYRLSLRKDTDAELLEYIQKSDIPVTELFRSALRMYMGGEQ